MPNDQPRCATHQVFRYHHEALEHLLHLAYYAMGLKPPALVKRVYSSAAAGMGTAKWRAAFRAADELPSNLQSLATGETARLLREPSGMQGREESLIAEGELKQGSDGAAGFNKANVKTERSWHRVVLSCQAGARAQAGAGAEVVLMAAHHKR